MTKIAGSGSASGSISQRHGSADPDLDPDPYQNVMNPKHCIKDTVMDSYVEVPNSYCINKLFEWLFSRVLASHRGGPGSISGRDMSVLGTSR